MESKKRTLQTMSPLKIGNVEMQNPLVLAPMAGVTDLPFRVLCKEQGAGLICMEMVSAKAILYKNKNTEDLMTIHPGEHPVSLQLFGSDPEILAQIAAQIEERPFDILDFNMGCPVPKVVNNGEGSALMKDPALVRKIVTGMVKAVKKPVTVYVKPKDGCAFEDAKASCTAAITAYLNAFEVGEPFVTAGLIHAVMETGIAQNCTVPASVADFTPNAGEIVTAGAVNVLETQ